MTHYKHSQFGKMVIGFFAGVMLLSAILFFFTSANDPSVNVPQLFSTLLFVYVLVAALFFNLTVEVTQTHLKIRFGLGLIQKSWPLEEIQSVEAVKNKWWFGWGIHYTPRGWLYNIDGMEAVEVVLKNGKLFRVGTDEANVLQDAIQKQLGK